VQHTAAPTLDDEVVDDHGIVSFDCHDPPPIHQLMNSTVDE
jgi:hypothetical protein